MTTQRMRKNIAFSNKNADIFEELTKMQKDGKNISDYICDLVRRDLAPKKIEVLNEDIDFLKIKLMTIETTLESIKKNATPAPNEGNKSNSIKNNKQEFINSNDTPAQDLSILNGLV